MFIITGHIGEEKIEKRCKVKIDVREILEKATTEEVWQRDHRKRNQELVKAGIRKIGDYLQSSFY